MKPQKQGLYSPEFEHDNCGAGFICNLEGKQTNDIIHKAIDILIRLEHRGAVGSDGRTGDGAGILIEIPHQFFKKVCDFELPEFKDYAVAMVFLPKSANQLKICKEIFQEEISAQKLDLIGWREVPIDRSCLGSIAKLSEPSVYQAFIVKPEKDSAEEFNAKLFAARKIAEHRIDDSELSEKDHFYVCSLSTNTIIYKGLLMPNDINSYYPDLNDDDVVTKLALVHQRFSTNTFPTWDLAQPFRYMCHNGEINTLRGNLSRMKAREELFENEFFGEDLKKIIPITMEGK